MKYNFFLKKSVCRFLLLSIGSVIWAGSIRAKEMYFLPSISLKTEYDDNKRLRRESNKYAAFGVIARANAKLGVRSDMYDVALDSQVSINHYEIDRNNVDIDSEDFKVNLTSIYSLTERSKIGLGGNYTRDTTITSEFIADANGDGEVTGEDGTGITDERNIIRQKWSIAPNWSYRLSDKQLLQANYSHSEVTYEKSDESSFVDYTIDFATVSFRHQWTALFSNSLSASAMFYDVPERDQFITEYSVDVGAEYQISPTWFASFKIGPRFTNTEAPDPDLTKARINPDTFELERPITSTDVQGLTFSFSVNKQFESGRAGVSYSRSTSAQGDGRLQQRDTVNAYGKYDLTPRWHLSLTGSFSDSSSANDDDNNNDRTYIRIKPSIRWLFDKQASLTAGYQYRTQEYKGSSTSGRATSNAVFLTFSYRWDKLSTQRY